MVDLDTLAALVLPWAKTMHPDKYQHTLDVASRPSTFRAYLLRLVEIRCAEDSEWRYSVPLSVLECTALTIRLRVSALNTIIEVKGARAEGPRVWTFQELAGCLDDPPLFLTLVSLKAALDMEHV